MAQDPSAKKPSEASRWPVVCAVVLGLSGGLMLSVPVSRLINSQPSSTESQPVASPQPVALANPFAGWTGFGAREVVVLGGSVLINRLTGTESIRPPLRPTTTAQTTGHLKASEGVLAEGSCAMGSSYAASWRA